MDEMCFDSVASHSVYTYSANKRIEEAFKQKEKKILLQQRKMYSRILRQKSVVFDDLIQLHVRTPSCEIKSKETEGEITEVGEIKLDPALYSKVIPRKLGQTRQTRQTSNVVNPVLRVVGASVFCNMQGGEDSEMELSTRPRTRTLLAKSDNICRCLRSLAERSAAKANGEKSFCEGEERTKPMQRAQTFYGIRQKTILDSDRRVATSFGRSLTKDSLISKPPNPVNLKHADFLSNQTNYKNISQRYLREKSLNKGSAKRNEYPTNDLNCHYSHLTKTSELDRPDQFDITYKHQKERLHTDCRQEVKHTSKAKHLAESIDCLKRTAGIGVKKRKMFVDSVQISGISFHDKRERYDDRVVMRNKWFC